MLTTPEVVKRRKEEPLPRNLTTCARPLGPLATKTIASLEAAFPLASHHPSPAMWAALTSIASAMEDMADGIAPEAVHVASLDPGVGKTQAVIHFLRALPPVTAFIIASVRSGIAEELPTIFPGASVLPWRPLPMEAKGKAGKAAKFIIERLSNGADSVLAADVMTHIGMSDKANFKRSVRQHPGFTNAIAEHGIIEWPNRRPTGFKNAFAAYFGNVVE